jgi:hypothetical protein
VSSVIGDDAFKPREGVVFDPGRLAALADVFEAPPAARKAVA